MIDKVVADDNNFANLVKLNESQGNGTVADVNRIRSKVIEVEALRTDIKTGPPDRGRRVSSASRSLIQVRFRRLPSALPAAFRRRWRPAP